MSALKQPALKHPRLMRQPQTPVTRTESVGIIECDAVEKNLPTGSQSTSSKLVPPNKELMKSGDTPRHPKGHKVQVLADVWKTMDKVEYLRLTDTLNLGDVWVQPVSAQPDRGSSAVVTMKELVLAPHIKFRDTTTKLSTDDLLKMLYLADCLICDVQNFTRMSYEDWLNEKSGNCVKQKGIEEGSDQAKLCHYILSDDSTFTFYPAYFHARAGIFFRKVCYHSYKNEGEKSKLNNPAMIKCNAVRGSFEYMIEARIIPLPDEWFISAYPEILPSTTETTELPESQMF